jgi:hypothetical protein
MRLFSQIFSSLNARALLYIIMVMSVFSPHVIASTNDIPKEFIGPHFAWGEETNRIRAGFATDVSNSKYVQVVVLTPKTNIAHNFLKPPTGKFARVVLRIPHGVVITPLPGRELDGELPQTIQKKDLPTIFNQFQNLLLLPPNIPYPLKTFTLQDSYQVKEEGDYTLTIWPVIYQFSTNHQFVTRMDLPPVSAKIHLKP